MIHAIFFDFNGVIIDDERIHLKAYREVLGSHGVELTDEDYFACLGMDDVAFTRAAFQRAGSQVDDQTTRASLRCEQRAPRSLPRVSPIGTPTRYIFCMTEDRWDGRL